MAKKLFRLLKSINTNLKIKLLRAGKLPDIRKTLMIIARLSLMVYFVFDNMSVLIKANIIGLNLKQMNMRACKWWLVSICCSLVCALIQLYKISNRKRNMLRSNSSTNGVTTDDSEGGKTENFESAPEALRAAKKTQLLDIVKNVCDSVTATHTLGYP